MCQLRRMPGHRRRLQGLGTGVVAVGGHGGRAVLLLRLQTTNPAPPAA